MQKHVSKIFDFVTISILLLMNAIYIWKHKEQFTENPQIQNVFYMN